MGMISHLLHTLEVETVGDASGTTAIIAIGVPQGGPASTTMFNVYMDPLALRLVKALHKPDRPFPGRLYADDVVLLLKYLWELMVALKICTVWANEFRMRWVLARGKSQLLLSPNVAQQIPSLPFAGGVIRTTASAKYLGVTLSAAGVSAATWGEKVRAAHATVTNLCSAKLLFPGVAPQYARMLYITMIQSTLDYAAHLCPMDEPARLAVGNLDRRFFEAVMGIRIRPTQLQRIRLLFRLDDRTLRNKTLAVAFQGRMLQLQQTTEANPTAAAQAAETSKAISHNPVIQQYLHCINGNSKNHLREAAFKLTAQRMSKPCPLPGANALPPALQIVQHDLRKLAVRWHLGFPVNAHILQRTGLQVLLEDFKLLSKPVLSPAEWSRLKISLQAANAGEIATRALPPIL